MTTIHRCDVCGEDYRTESKLASIGVNVDGIVWDDWEVCDDHLDTDGEGDLAEWDMREQAFQAVKEVLE